MNANFGDNARNQLRTIVSKIELEISQLPAGNAKPTQLRTSWDELVDALALGPAPETRVCPACQGVGMRAATRCAHCWVTLEPLAATEGTPS